MLSIHTKVEYIKVEKVENEGLLEDSVRFGDITVSNAEGGFIGSLLMLSSSMIGLGFLTLPKIGTTNGIIPMVFMVTLSLLMSFIGNIQIARGYKATKAKTYPEIIELLNGQTYCYICTFFLFVYVYTISAVFLVFCSNFLLDFVIHFGLRNKDHTEGQNHSFQVVSIIQCGVLIASY